MESGSENGGILCPNTDVANSKGLPGLGGSGLRFDEMEGSVLNGEVDMGQSFRVLLVPGSSGISVGLRIRPGRLSRGIDYLPEVKRDKDQFASDRPSIIVMAFVIEFPNMKQTLICGVGHHVDRVEQSGRGLITC